MASKGESVGSLFLTLGLDLTSLESGYLEADKSVLENQRKLQKVIDSNKLKLKMESKLDGLEAAQNQLKLLNDTLKLQTEQVKIAEAEFKKCYAEAGAGAQKTLNAERQLIKLQSSQADTINQIRQLESKAINDKISKINTEMNLVRQRIELYKSSPVLDAEQKHNKALEETNRLLELQKQKVHELSAAYQNQVKNTGAKSVQSMSLQTSLLRESTTLNQMQTGKTAELAALAMLSAGMNKASATKPPATGTAELAANKNLASEYGNMFKTMLMGSFVSPVLGAVSAFGVLKPLLTGTVSEFKRLKDTMKAIEGPIRDLLKDSSLKNLARNISHVLPFNHELDLSGALRMRGGELWNWYAKQQGATNPNPGAWPLKKENYPDLTRKQFKALEEQHRKNQEIYKKMMNDPATKAAFERHAQMLESYIRQRSELLIALGREANSVMAGKSLLGRAKSYLVDMPLNYITGDVNGLLMTFFRNVKTSVMTNMQKMLKWTDNAMAINAGSTESLFHKMLRIPYENMRMMMPENIGGIMKSIQDAMRNLATSMLAASKNFASFALSAADKIPVIGQVTKAIRELYHWAGSMMPDAAKTFSGALSMMGEALGFFARVVSIPAILTGIAYAVAKLGEKAAEAGDAVVSLAGRLHTTNGEASKLKRAMSFVGVDVEDGVNSLLRMNKQVMSAKDGANDTTRMLHAFGVELKNQDGTFKDYNQQLEALARGYAKAKELGMSTEFMTTLFGTRGKAMYDFFDEYDKVMQMSANVKTAGILNPDTAHEMKMQYGQLNAQVSQLTAGISQLFAVAAEPVIQPLTELFKELVSVIYENKVAYKAFFAAIGEGLKLSVQLFQTLFIPALKVTSAQASILCKAIIEDLCPGINYLGACAATAWVRMKHLFSGWNTDECRAELRKVYEELENDNKYLHDMLYGADKKILPEIDTDEQKRALAEITGETEKAEKEREEAHKKAVDNMNEADKIRYHLTHTNVENQMYDLEQLTNQQLAEAKTEEEANSIRALSAAKLLEIQKNAEREAEEIHKRAQQNIQEAESLRFKRSHNEWQNQLYDIQQNAEAQAKLAKSAEETKSVWKLAAEKTADVWQKLIDKIKDMNRSLEDKIFALTHTEKEVKQHETAKEAQNYLQQGADPRLVQRWYDLVAQKEGFGQRGDSYNFGHVIDLQQQETANSGSLLQQVTELVNYNRQQSYASNRDTYGSMGHVIDLNVNVYGLEDVSNEVAQTAAKEIIERMPGDSQYNIGFGF